MNLATVATFDCSFELLGDESSCSESPALTARRITLTSRPLKFHADPATTLPRSSPSRWDLSNASTTSPAASAALLLFSNKSAALCNSTNLYANHFTSCSKSVHRRHRLGRLCISDGPRGLRLLPALQMELDALLQLLFGVVATSLTILGWIKRKSLRSKSHLWPCIFALHCILIESR